MAAAAPPLPNADGRTSTRRSYYRAGKLGSGSFGAVVRCYDDDGAEWAAKLFEDEEDEDEECYDEDESVPAAADPSLPVGVLREISMLKLLNGAHPAVMRVEDVTEIDDDGTKRLAMVMPLMTGDLSNAIEAGRLSNKQKLTIAARLLHVLAFMHEHNIMHRDIKPDNVLLDAEQLPVLADFSLAKQHCEAEGNAAAKAEARPGKGHSKRNKQQTKERAAVHTAGMGTPTYTAPEVVRGDDYDLKADVWSMGVVLLELFMGALGSALKDKHAFAHIEELKAKMGSKPLPTLLKAMLHTEPTERISARQALEMLPGVDSTTPAETSSLLLLPPPPELPAVSKGKKPKQKASGEITPSRACALLTAENPLSEAAADYFFSRCASARRRGSLGAMACAFLACKLHEVEAIDLSFASDALEEAPGTDASLAYDFEEGYVEMEREVVEELGWCLAVPLEGAKLSSARKVLGEKNC